MLVVATLACLHTVLECGFANFDDGRIVTENARVLEGFTWEGMRFALLHPEELELWLPLTWYAHMLDVELFGLWAPGHHLTSLLLHLLNVILLYAVFRTMTGQVWPSAFTALLFAIHPLHVEPVVWIASRKDLLSTFFLLITLLAYGYYARRRSALRYALVAWFYLLSLASKPMVVTLPFVLLLLDYWPLARYRDAGGCANQWKRFWVLFCEKTPLMVLAFACSALAFHAARAGGSMTSETYSLSFRAVNALTSYLAYLGKTIWPTRLAPHYPLVPGETPLVPGILAGLVLVTVSLLVLRARRTYPFAVTGWFWYLGTLVPVIGLIQVGSHRMADRYTYVPLIGLFLVLSWGAPALVQRWRYGKLAIAYAAGIAALLLMTCTYLQVQHWRTNEALWRHTLAVTEKNIIAHLKLGSALVEQGRMDEAAPEFEKALELNPRFPEPINSLAFVLLTRGEFARAEKLLLNGLEHCPNDPRMHQHLAVALAGQRRFEQAKAASQRALLLDPTFAEAREFLAALAEGRLPGMTPNR